ncbi:hypothetical protein TVAG_491080 [Trichomonas vaginalis G3]|uniref:Uncharacterized protein n=1 Tax=Trichomonas vaginalis (strain ATCC PRA-98 / G3) TaxID=412133 RepID=A2E051_TRIV3|nr:carbohydrate binding [Trichomonas vaginalis G3]EAY13970.1 hypothetical protein TVAG_491080 [Trichomonas vaginalis G3]KAI5551788.1 carbohydrate binding [Trichomonas vaginalis G3]|eukprot:XP_001326193.1 hypothetical protein [Trichomonas vaginalis G3]
MILFFVFSCISSEASYIDGFVNFNFTFTGDRKSFFSNLSILILTVDNSLIDQVEVQPSGYWISDAILPNRVNISILSSDGIYFAEKSKIISSLENSSINFLVTGLGIKGSVLVSSDNVNMPISVPLKLEIYRYSTQTRFIVDIIAGSFSIDNVIPDLYRFNILNVKFNETKINLTEKPLNDIKLIIDTWDPHGIVIVPPNISIFPLKLSVESKNYSREIITDESGNFILRKLRKGNYEISCKSDQFNITKVNITVGEIALTELIKLHYIGTTVRGTISFKPGKPCNGALITFVERNISVFSDSNGKFTFYNVMPINNATFAAEYYLWEFEIQTLTSITYFPRRDIIFRATHGPVHVKSSCLEYNVSFSSKQHLNIETHNGSISFSAPLKELSMISLSTKCNMKNDTAIFKAPCELYFSQISSKVFGSVLVSLRISNMSISLIGKKIYKCQCNEKGRFSFEDVEFGEYEIHLIHPNSVVYNQSIFFVNVTSDEIDVGVVAHFAHYVFNINSDHEVSILASPDVVQQLKQGNNLVKVIYKEILSADCFNFEKPKFPNKIFINNISEYYKYNLKVTEAVRKVEVKGDLMIHQTIIKVNNKQLKYPYKFIQRSDQSVKVECIVQKPFVVDHPKLYVPFPSHCDEIISFDVYRNNEIDGKIIPAIKNVNVSVISDDKVLSWNLTDKNGRYHFSRLPTLSKIILKAEKRRFKFVPRKNTFDFDGYRLFNIKLSFPSIVNDGIVSISNSKGFHQNKKISNNTVIFSNLTEGDYFVKPIMKEFDFNPNIKSFSLFENDVTFAFEACKNRFSIAGFVFESNRKPVIGRKVFVNRTYESQTDNTGKFTFSNLKSQQNYEITFENSESEVVTPKSQIVLLQRENHDNINFTVIKRNDKYDLFGEISSTDYDLTELSVFLKCNGKVIDDFYFKSSIPLFFFIGLDKHQPITLQIVHKNINGNINVCYEKTMKNISFVNASCFFNERSSFESEEYSSFESSLCVIILFIILFVLYNFKLFRK